MENKEIIFYDFQHVRERNFHVSNFPYHFSRICLRQFFGPGRSQNMETYFSPILEDIFMKFFHIYS